MSYLFGNSKKWEGTVLDGTYVGSIYTDACIPLSNGNILIIGNSAKWELRDANMNLIRKMKIADSDVAFRHSIQLSNSNVLIVNNKGEVFLYNQAMTTLIKRIVWSFGTLDTFAAIQLDNGNIVIGGSGRYEIFDSNLTPISSGYWGHGNSHGFYRMTRLSSGKILLIGSGGRFATHSADFTKISSYTWNSGSSWLRLSIELSNGNILLVGVDTSYELFNSDMVSLNIKGKFGGLYDSMGSSQQIPSSNNHVLFFTTEKWIVINNDLTTLNSGSFATQYNLMSSLKTKNNDILMMWSQGSALMVGFNENPILSDNTVNFKIFYEQDTISINGSVKDTNIGDIVSVKYKINNGTTRAIATAISDGTAPIAYSKTLKYTNGKLFDGVTEVANGLIDGQTYNIQIWGEDDQGGKSQEIVRTFYVVPNRPPILAINSIENQSNKINSEKITVTGNVTDADNNNVTVSVRINNNSSIQIYEGVPSDFTFNIKIADLAEGENIITVTTKDTFDFTTTKTIKLNKTRNAVQVKEAIVRYKVKPPSGSAKQILAWVQREVGALTVDADISMVLDGEQEQYSPMTKLTAPINDFIEEDEFTFESDVEKDNIVLKLRLSKEDASSDKSIKQISGVLK